MRGLSLMTSYCKFSYLKCPVQTHESDTPAELCAPVFLEGGARCCALHLGERMHGRDNEAGRPSSELPSKSERGVVWDLGTPTLSPLLSMALPILHIARRGKSAGATRQSAKRSSDHAVSK